MKHPTDHTLWKLTRGQRLPYAAAVVALWVAIVLAFGVPLVTMVALDALDPDAEAAGHPWLQPLAEGLAWPGSP